MDKQPVGQLPDLTQSNNDDEIMVITNSEYNQLKKEKISDFITDLTSTDENNAIVKGTDGKLFTKDFGNASNITEGTLPVSVLPDIPKDLLPESGVTAGTYITPTNLQVNSKGQITSISEGAASGISREDIDTVAARPLSDNACTQENFPDEFDYWYNQKYTTFNKGFISTIGTPTMTEYGVISNCGDYSYFLTPSIDVTTANSWEMRFTYTPSGTTPTTAIGLFGSNWLNVSFTTAEKITATVNYTGGSLTLTSSGTFNNDDKIFCKIRYDLTGYKLYASVNQFDYGTAATNSQTAKAASAQALKLGNVSATSYLSQGSIDMKYFEFDINGQNVQNYKQTGIDTIKAPDYTVVGSPTISADGIASGFSESNYLSKTISLDSFTTFDLVFKFKTPETITTQNVVIGNSSMFPVINYRIGTDRTVFCEFSISSSTRHYGSSPITLKDNTDYYGKISYDKSAVTFYYSENEIDDFNILTTFNNITDFNGIYDFSIGIGRSLGNVVYAYPFKGSINLNSFKIYVDDVLIYQPCLYIPYTETTDGTKIVDAAYFDRVQSCREQTGQALYLTLDEQNQQYYLPQGTVSGFISQNKQGLEELNAKINDTLYPYGFPMPSLDGVLHDNEIWLEGAVVSRTDYVNVFNVYGTTYGEGDGSTTFQLPDFRGKVPWGSADGTFGYIEAGLPNITGEYTPTVNTGSAATRLGLADASTGAFSNFETGQTAIAKLESSTRTLNSKLSFNASRSNSIYSDSVTTVQPPSFKVKWKTRYK